MTVTRLDDHRVVDRSTLDVLDATQPPRLADGKVDIRAYCRQLDDEYNAGIGVAARATWDDDDEVDAQREGWSIFDCIGSENGPVQIQRFDTPSEWSQAPAPYPFAEDTDVWEHVWGQALAGSDMHARALAFVRQENPTEADAIERWVAARTLEAATEGSS
jgi:hypothetical protein